MKICIQPRYPGTLKSDLGIREDEKVLIHISNFREVKNIPDILNSFKKIVSSARR